MEGNNHRESSSFFRRCYQAKQSRAQKDGKEKGSRFNPGRTVHGGTGAGGRGGGVGVIPRERGAKERWGAEEQT